MLASSWCNLLYIRVQIIEVHGIHGLNLCVDLVVVTLTSKAFV